MSIESTISKAGPYIADGAQTKFPFGFVVQDASHVAVYSEDGELTDGFRIELVDNGGSVIFRTPPTRGSRIAILRNIPITQETDIQNNTPFYPEVIEAALDKLTMIAQQLAEEVSRCAQVPSTEELDNKAILQAILQFNEKSAAVLEEVRLETLRCKEYAELAASTSVVNAVGYEKIGEVEIDLPTGD